jgi:hypothetical protein
MRKVVLFTMIFAVFSFTTTKMFNISKTIYVSSESKLYIKGTSNVNKFECHYDITNLNNPVPVKLTQNGQTLYFKNTKLILDSGCFDCGGKAINKDFKSILKANEYPNIVLNVIELNPVENDISKVEVMLNIEIAGIKKPYKMIANLSSHNKYQISGKLKLNINDFNLESPKKMFGLIVVSEIIEINFEMKLQEK